MIKTKTQMNLNHFNDFYLIEAIKAEIGMAISAEPQLEFSHSINKLQEDIEEYCADLYPNMAMRIFVYLYAACAGEARHAQGVAAQDFYYPEIPTSSRGDAFREILKFAPSPENINALIEIFQQKWIGSFGGQKWLEIAKALKMYFEVSPVTFIDHVVDLQHNNGTVFSKGEAKYFEFYITYSGYFPQFLDDKFHLNILKDLTQTMAVMRKTEGLIRRWERIFRAKSKARTTVILESLSDYHIEWGNKTFTRTNKWLSWANCENGNTPNLRWMMDKLVRTVHPSKLPEKELKKAMGKIKKEGLTNLKAFKGMKKEWKLYVDAKHELYKKVCPMKKQKTLYHVIPCKIKGNSSGWGKTEIQVPLPYYGYGTKTDYGFKFENHHVVPPQGRRLGYDGRKGFLDAIIEADDGVKIQCSKGVYYIGDKKLEAILA
jgi:hypothetical protein